MKLEIDTQDRSLRISMSNGDAADSRTIPLFSPEAFELVSREWVRVGWALGYYTTFTWSGQPILQLPEDLVRLQEVVTTLQPDLIIEMGVCEGGSLLFHASLCEALGKGRVIGVDIQVSPATRKALESHRLARRIEALEGDSTAPATVEEVRRRVKPGERVMVILDSHHSKEHVARELEAYAPLVTEGSCIVAADGIMEDLADVPGGESDWVWNNPASAAREFAAMHPDEFEMREPAWLSNRGPLRKNTTYWPDGWLWRKV